jgi:CspA family cold shock protein
MKEQGVVRMFDARRGFGFILGLSGDIFVHFSNICMPGYKSLSAGQTVEFDAVPDDRGLHAENVSVVTY